MENVKKKAGLVCSYKHCKNKTYTGAHKFYRFPQDAERAKSWLIACDREDLSEKVDKLYKGFRICDSHFSSYMFQKGKRKLLRTDAVPLKMFPSDLNEALPCSSSSNNEYAQEKSSDILHLLAEPSTDNIDSSFDETSYIRTSSIHSPILNSKKNLRQMNEALLSENKALKRENEFLRSIDVIKNFTNKAEKHQSSKKHIKNMELFLMVGKTRVIREKEKLTVADVKKYCEEEVQRREVMSQIIDAIFFLIKRQKNYNQSNINIYLLELITEKYVYESFFKQIYGKMHNKLIPLMESVMLEDVKKEIVETEFCSIQTDEIQNKIGEYSVIIRYVHNGLVKERFIGFFEIHKTFDLAKIINTIIGDARKLVCHSYDGSVSMKMIRHGIRSIIPKVLFLHNHTHKLNMLLLQGLQNIKECKTFSDQVMLICDYFRVTRRSAMLKKEGVFLPSRRETLWMFNSKAVSIIIKNYAKIFRVLNNIIVNRHCLDLDSKHSACGVQICLKNQLFVLLSCLFNKIFVYADHLSNIIQRKINLYVDNCIQEIAQTVKNISNFKTDIIIKHCVDEAKTHLRIETIPVTTIDQFKRTAFAIIDSVVDQIEERFRDSKFLKFVELLDGARFINYKNKFPKLLLHEFIENYFDLFDIHCLENELTMVYGDSSKRFNPYQLFSYLYDNGLTELYKETYKLLRLYLTYPLIPTNLEETCCTLTKVRNYLNITEGYNEEKSAILFVEKYSNDTSDYSLFKDKVINNFNKSEVDDK